MTSKRREAKQMISRGEQLTRKGFKLLEEVEGDSRENDDHFIREFGSPEAYHNWKMALMRVNLHHREFGWAHPMGTCAYRDILRDAKVDEALKDAFDRIIVNGEGPRGKDTPENIDTELFPAFEVQEDGSVAILLNVGPIRGGRFSPKAIIWRNGEYHQSGDASAEQIDTIMQARKLVLGGEYEKDSEESAGKD